MNEPRDNIAAGIAEARAVYGDLGQALLDAQCDRRDQFPTVPALRAARVHLARLGVLLSALLNDADAEARALDLDTVRAPPRDTDVGVT